MNVFIAVKNCYLSKIESTSWIDKQLEWGQEISKLFTVIKLRFTNGNSASAIFSGLEATDIFGFFYNKNYEDVTSKELYDLMLESFTPETDSIYSQHFYYHYT